MTKADLIEEVSRVVEMTRKESEVIVETIFDSVVRSLRTGEKIEIRGFGSFRTRQRQPRVGRNPKTGARVEVPAKKIPYFKPSKELKDVVNNSALTEEAAVTESSPAAPSEEVQMLESQNAPLTPSTEPAGEPALPDSNDHRVPE
jgi:integration host factor subunit beta